jgi:hypothetical protein
MKAIKLTPQEVKGIMGELGKMQLAQSINLYRFFEQKINEAASKEKQPDEIEQPEELKE